MKEVLTAASSGGGRQEMNMEKNILIQQPGIHLARKLLSVSVSLQCALDDLQQGLAVRMVGAKILVCNFPVQ